MDKNTFMALRKMINQNIEKMDVAQIESIIFMLEAELMDRDLENIEEAA